MYSIVSLQVEVCMCMLCCTCMYTIYDNVGWISANSHSCTAQSAEYSSVAGKTVQCKFECFHHRSCKPKNVIDALLIYIIMHM